MKNEFIVTVEYRRKGLRSILFDRDVFFVRRKLDIVENLILRNDVTQTDRIGKMIMRRNFGRKWEKMYRIIFIKVNKTYTEEVKFTDKLKIKEWIN